MRIGTVLLFIATTAFAQAPRIDSVSPAQGPIAGGTTITLSGVNFTGGVVTVDGALAGPASVADGEIQMEMPRHENGYATIRVLTPSGSAATTFLYLPPALRDLPPGFITTIAGVGTYYGDYRPALDASISAGQIGYAIDGSLYIADVHHNRVLRVRPDRILEPFAGTGLPPEPATFQSPSPRLEIALGYARSIVVEQSGDVEIADDPSHRIWRVSSLTGQASVLAGTGVAGFSGDGGPSIAAAVNEPNFMIGDRRGTLWFLDSGNARLRRIDPDGTITTVCGTGTRGFSGDGGPATEATFDSGNADFGNLAYDDAGRFLYFADNGNHRIRRIELTHNIVTTFIGPEHPVGLDVNNTLFRAMIVAPNGDLYLNANAQILHLSRDGNLIESWGSATPGLARTFDGTKLSDMLMGSAIGFELDHSGNLLYADDDVNRVMRLNRQSGLLETVVSAIGPGVFGENGPALAASPIEKIGPYPDLFVTPAGEVFFSGRRIRKIGLDGRLSVVASTGQAMTGGDGVPATAASYVTGGLDFDSSGNLYAATFLNIAQIDRSGILRRVAGINDPQHCGLSGDGGPALAASLCQPWDVAVDRGGNLFIADTNHNRIRRVDAKTQTISTVAGSGPINGFENYFHGSYCGDGGPAAQACLDTPVGIAVTPAGELFIAEWGRVRKVDRSGTISTIAGLTGKDFLSVDSAGCIYTVQNSDIVRVTPAGAVQRIAGHFNGEHGFSGDGGPASDALLLGGGGIGIDGEGNLYFVDGGNRRIRAVRFGAVLAPANATIRAAAAGSTIRATVLDASGLPAPSVRVDFTAPASGPSCTLASPFAVTDANGIATVTCTPNCVKGTYAVTATPLASSSQATLSMTNFSCHQRATRH